MSGKLNSQPEKPVEEILTEAYRYTGSPESDEQAAHALLAAAYLKRRGARWDADTAIEIYRRAASGDADAAALWLLATRFEQLVAMAPEQRSPSREV